MLYFKTTQPVPGKGDAWMYYECTDDKKVRRYLTYIPATREINRVPNPVVKTLYQPDLLEPATQEEFEQYWPPAEAVEDAEEAADESGGRARRTQGRHFSLDMTVGEAMGVHPKVTEVFAAFHLGGCASCGISEFETVGQVCMGYGVDPYMLLEVLEGLVDSSEAGAAS